MATGTLSPKQKAFCENYIIDFNASAALRRAGYSPKGAAATASILLGKPHIQAEIQRQMKERSNRTRVTADSVLSELANLAFSDIRNIMDWDNNNVTLKRSDEMQEIHAKTIESIQFNHNMTEIGESSSKKVKMHSKIKALELCGRHLGMWDGDGKPKDRDRSSNLSRISELLAGYGKRG